MSNNHLISSAALPLATWHLCTNQLNYDFSRHILKRLGYLIRCIICIWTLFNKKDDFILLPNKMHLSLIQKDTLTLSLSKEETNS